MATLLQDVWPVLLDGMLRFLRIMPRPAKKRCSPETKTVKPTLAKATRSSSSEMSSRAPKGENVARSLLAPARTHVSALGLGGRAACLALLRMPPDRRGWREAKSCRRCPATQPAFNRNQKPNPQIH